MKLLVTGAGGLLGQALVEAARGRGHDVAAPARSELDVTDAAAVTEAVGDARPEWVLHCAAYTRVDAAEGEPAAAMAVNRDGTRNVAAAADASGSAVAYLSTDFVFDGALRRPYAPGDEPAPVNAYGRSKLAGERALREAPGLRWLVLRTSWLYGSGGRNFVDAIVERGRSREAMRVVEDQRGRPTWAGSLAPALVELVEGGAEGVLHLADGGEASWFELAEEALSLAGVRADVEPVSSDEWGAAAPRPPYSVLDTRDAERRLGRPMPHWRASLRRYLAGA